MAGAVKYEMLFFLIGIAAGLILILPFFSALVFAAIFAFLLSPIHNRLSKHIPDTWSAAILTIISTVIVIAILALGAKIVLDEISTVYLYFRSIDFGSLAIGGEGIGESFEALSSFLFTQLISYSSSFVSKLPGLVLSFAVFVFTLFFFIKDGEKSVAWLKTHLPLSTATKNGIFKDIKNYAYAFINVWLVIATVQAVFATLGFYVFGLPYPIIAGLIAGVLSILPSIGPFALYVPVGAYYLFVANPVIGMGILIYGLIVGSILDYIVRPYLAGRWSNAHPLVILLGVFGGLVFLGPAGIIVGPIILLVATAFLKEIGMRKTA